MILITMIMNDKNYNYKGKSRLKKEESGNKKVLLVVGFILLGIYGPLLVDYFQSYRFSSDDPLCELSHLNLEGCR